MYSVHRSGASNFQCVRMRQQYDVRGFSKCLYLYNRRVSSERVLRLRIDLKGSALNRDYPFEISLVTASKIAPSSTQDVRNLHSGLRFRSCSAPRYPHAFLRVGRKIATENVESLSHKTRFTTIAEGLVFSVHRTCLACAGSNLIVCQVRDCA